MGIWSLDSELVQLKGTACRPALLPPTWATLSPWVGGSAAASFLLTTSVELSAVTAKQLCLIHDRGPSSSFIWAPFGKFCREQEWSGCGPVPMVTVPAPKCGRTTPLHLSTQAAVKVQPFSQRPHGPCKSLTSHFEGVIIVPAGKAMVSIK